MTLFQVTVTRTSDTEMYVEANSAKEAEVFARADTSSVPSEWEWNTYYEASAQESSIKGTFTDIEIPYWDGEGWQ